MTVEDLDIVNGKVRFKFMLNISKYNPFERKRTVLTQGSDENLGSGRGIDSGDPLFDYECYGCSIDAC